jgi:hypothetical protein
MTTPSPSSQTYQALLEVTGLELTPERFADAMALHESMRPQLEALRAIPLSFLDPVIEPATALQWIEDGGVSA